MTLTILLCCLAQVTILQAISFLCECVHIIHRESCENSTKCFWNQSEERCLQASDFLNQNLITSHCAQFAEDDCIQEKRCAFYLGKCIEFVRCENFMQERCDQASLQCISDGNKCMQKGLCSDYLTQIACQKLNSMEKYCKWVRRDGQYFCEDVQECNELPVHLKLDRDCRKQMEKCTISLNGGCEISKQLCNQYTNKEQCYFNLYQAECFWDGNLQKCLENICINRQSSNFEECQKIDPDCTTNGYRCIKKLECEQYDNSYSCVEDSKGKKCIFYKGQCLKKNCQSAPSFINTMIECSVFQNSDIVCVPKVRGGCQETPQQCDELETEDSCSSVKQLQGKYCFWQDKQNVCKIKQCSDAPLLYSHTDCIGWLDDYACIGGLGNGCIENVDDCSKILNLKSCVKDKLNRKCMIENGQCLEEICQNLQFPFYQSILDCENRLSICTFSVYNKTCINKECSHLEEIQCNFDYSFNKCIQLPGCIHKICESASVYFGTHEECENWNVRCTINAGKINGVPYRNGCITKDFDCTYFKYQIQCVNTIQGIPCFWNSQGNQCEFRNCNNAPSTFQTIAQCQQWVQYHDIKCIPKENGGCIQQHQNCQGLSDKVQCLIGSEQGLCYWDITTKQCQNRTCENASNATSNVFCKNWLHSCIFKPPNLCQSDNAASTLCRDAPRKIDFTSHEECQAWNPNCTLKLGQACFSEDNCSDYITLDECKHNQKIYVCQWDISTNPATCIKKPCTALNSQNSVCVAHSLICTSITTSDDLGNYYHTCDIKLRTCSLITDQAQCNQHSVTEKCQWATVGTVSSCSAVPCNHFEANLTETICQNRQFNCFFNSITSSCETLESYCPLMTDISYSGCQSSQKQCILDEPSNKCVLIKHCSDTTTYQDQTCSDFYGYCQSKNFTSGCQFLAPNCSDYKIIENCKINFKKEQCYWSSSLGKCIDLSCSLIEETLTTHTECQQLSSDCTLNFHTTHSCMDLGRCDLYQKKEQCYLDSNKQKCSWIKNNCILDNCKAAPKGIYTLQQCQEQFGVVCTINEDRSGCINKLDNCSQYNKFQCLTPNQANNSEVACFWDQINLDCKEHLCHKANQLIKQLIECEQFNHNCQTKQCKISLCDDYKYDLDVPCSLALKNHKCTTDGFQCVERRLCSDANMAGCTFSINYQDCIWLDDENRCADKTCSVASRSLKTHQQCQDYLEQCTNKIGGGCVIITTCQSISSSEACIYDQNNELCVWDESNKKCIYLSCSSICGDGVVGNEEFCDDGNILPYDGCYKCRIQCQYGCNSCIKHNCLDCNQGFELSQNAQCLEICGDGLKVGQEECDDMNTIPNDGCYECRFQCHQDCLDCNFGVCNKCAFGWEEYNTQCRSVCGNGLLVESLEQCDDGNTDDGDGCNSVCQVEEDWECVQSQFTKISECKMISHPKIILQNLSQKRDSQQIIRLKFNQQVQLKQYLRFEDFIKVNVTKDVDFQLLIQPILEASLSLQFVEYNFQITILEKVEYPQVSIQFITSILVNSEKYELTKLMDTISLGTPLILSLEQYSRLNSTIAFNEIMIYIFIGSSSVSVLIGNLDLFFNMLTLLQQLSYVRYLSVPFPSHLDEYLKVFKVVSFQPLYDKLNIDSLFQKLNVGKAPFIKSKNVEKQHTELNNAFFLVNAKSFYLTMFLSIFCYLLANLFIRQTQSLCQKLLKIQKLNYLKFFNKIFNSIQQFALKSSNHFIYSGLIKVFISSQYQLMYSAYSQFPEYQFKFEVESLFETFNSFNALICMIIPHIFLFKSVVVLRKQYNSENVNQYSIFYENIKPDYWSRFFIPFSMIKVSIYMAIICFLFNSAVIQSISLIILCITFCSYVIVVKPVTQKIELRRLIIREITFLSIITSFFPYCLNLDDEIINILGWVHIGLFTIILGSNIIIDIVKYSIQLISSYKRRQIKVRQSEQRQYFINGLQQFINVDNTSQNICNGQLSIGFEAQSNYQSQILSLR
ncbi:unnamed protein product (macronuclear) [Paramecium tetraurelia]|uniref:EGF-like domain-containing protein n=1 Tax=Paramecium tetraurelia TaxID=5888 RepID=A0CJJ3_PARTE|nr:uncharacterized protein GSPATT00000671001 [Paramecium tetraurelia]CAK70960.1 unnamed protein product [Paramecium tetraurelia]|eukprot:XP_001438357.1 hypothetical protein (macronuclear) [Paramecium tetraurelia strain d4-2]